MSRILYLAILVAMVLALVVSPAVAAPGEPAGKVARNGGPSNNYVVHMVGAPVVAYDGGIPGYPATKPAKGQKIDPNDPKVVKYVGFLEGRHNDALNKVGGRLLYHYSFSFNGFAAELSEEQAAKLAADPNVLAVDRDQIYEVDTSSTPAFLGLKDPGGLWDQLGGVDKAGDGIIIGIIDSGIWPESLSFSDRTGDERQRVKEGKAGLPADPRLARQVHPRRRLQRLDVQPETDRRPVVQRCPGAATPALRRSGPGSSFLPATTVVMARTLPPPLAVTMAFSSPAPQPSSARSAAWPRTPASRCTRRCGRRRTR